MILEKIKQNWNMDYRLDKNIIWLWNFLKLQTIYYDYVRARSLFLESKHCLIKGGDVCNLLLSEHINIKDKS